MQQAACRPAELRTQTVPQKLCFASKTNEVLQGYSKFQNFGHFCPFLHGGLLTVFTPNDPYMGRTAPLTSKRRILYIYSTNIGTEYFKHALYSTFFFSSKCSLFHNANLFGSCIIHILYTGCAEIKKKIV